jgi:hypothetical protein
MFNCRPLNAESRVRVLLCPCAIYGGNRKTETGFSTSSSVSPASIIPLGLHGHKLFGG